MTEQQLVELQARNAQRMKEAKEQLGKLWLYHPSNSVKKKVKTK